MKITNSATSSHTADFTEITRLITAARARAVQAVNTALIDLYWQVGQTISQKIAQAQWGDGVVALLAAHLAQTQPGLRGFTRSNLFRMRKFFETYQGDEVVAPLARQLPWSHNLIILNQAKRPEEREFYLRLSIREKWGKRELVAWKVSEGFSSWWSRGSGLRIESAMTVSGTAMTTVAMPVYRCWAILDNWVSGAVATDTSLTIDIS